MIVIVLIDDKSTYSQDTTAYVYDLLVGGVIISQRVYRKEESSSVLFCASLAQR